MLLHNLKQSKSGFTLVETLIAFSIFLLVLDGVWVMYKNTTDTNAVLTSNLSTQMEVRKAFTSMTASMRSASPSSAGAYPIEAASSTGVIYYSDIDHDNLKERIRYYRSGNTIKQGITKPSGSPLIYSSVNENSFTIVHGVVNTAVPIFSYFDTNYNGSTDPLAEPINITSIRLIKINIQIDSDPARPPAAAYFTTQVSIRNLKDNM